MPSLVHPGTNFDPEEALRFWRESKLNMVQQQLDRDGIRILQNQKQVQAMKELLKKDNNISTEGVFPDYPHIMIIPVAGDTELKQYQLQIQGHSCSHSTTLEENCRVQTLLSVPDEIFANG
jgi:hypothetical protein